MDIRYEVENWFPNIKGNKFKIIESTDKFNCVSFSLDIYDKWIWTNEDNWPYEDIPRNIGINGFIKLYNKYGYSECDSDSYEEGYDKIAFYAKNNIPKHACKQFDNIWKSKIGTYIIEHELDWLCGNTEDAYGDVVFIMKRKK
jgi:hypothetical protein